MDAKIETLPPENKLLLSCPEAARMLSVSVRTLYSLFENGELRSVLIRRSRRIRLADLQAYIDGLNG